MDRRSFLKLQAILAAGTGLGLLTPLPSLSDDTPYIGVARGEPARATRTAVALLGGMDRFVSPGQKVVIKPNMSFPDPPESATNTNPEVVRELAVMCKEAGASRIWVLDNPLSGAERCMEGSGIPKACEVVPDTEVYGLQGSRFFEEAVIPEGREMRKNTFIRQVLEADVLIAAPKAKSHSSTGVSLSLKGMMGLVGNRRAMHGRYDLDTAIVDLNTRLRARLVVVDASNVLSSGGPFGPGDVLTPRLVATSADPVAADAWAVNEFAWYGKTYLPRQVRHIKMAHERGLGRMDLDSLAIERVEA